MAVTEISKQLEPEESVGDENLKREYPARPIVGVGAIIISNQKILLAKRGSEPGRNKWSIPGGLVELGEKVQDTVIREVKEETGLDVKIHSLVDVVDNLEPDKMGKWRYHFVIVDYIVSQVGGSPRAASDVLDLRWVSLEEAENYDLTSTLRDFFKRNMDVLKRYSSCQKVE